MLHTLWPSLVVVVTLFPGILSYLLSRISPFKRIPDTYLFAICAAGVVLVDIISCQRQMMVYFFIPFIIPIVFILDYFMQRRFKEKEVIIELLSSSVLRIFIVLIVFPVLEEYIYRYYLYTLIVDSGGNAFLYIAVSSLLFVASHFYSQREKSLSKLPVGIVLGSIFLLTENLAYCLFFHISLNFLIYIANSFFRTKKYFF